MWTFYFLFVLNGSCHCYGEKKCVYELCVYQKEVNEISNFLTDFERLDIF